MVADFIFDGQSLSSFGYMICDFNAVGLETSTISEMNYTDIQAKMSDVSHKVSTSYGSNLQRTIQIIKKNCNNNDSYHILNDEISELAKWLCRKDYKWFKWVNDTDDDDIFYQVRINLRQISLGNDNIGFELDIISNRPYGLTQEIKITRDFKSNVLTAINVYSDEEGYIYPDMVITLMQDGDLEITNEFENRTSCISNCTNGEIITVLGSDVLQIYSSNKSHKFSESFDYNFPRLCNTYRNTINNIKTNLNCNIEFKYRGIRKVGI